MQLNPILALELRARWRANRSFWLLLGIALTLSLVAGFIYQRAVFTTSNSSFDPRTGSVTPALESGQASAVGRQLFVALGHVNIIVWLLIAAAAAAPTIARERERGLLESLQLSRMSARSQIAARFTANLMLLGALQLVVLPVYAVSFLMGGVSQWELGSLLILVAWATITGTSLGLWFSARSHRAASALFGALGAIALFSALVYFNSYAPWTPWGFRFSQDGLEAMLLFHPNALFGALSEARFTWIITPQQTLMIFSATHFAFCALLLWSAIRNVNRPLSAPAWQTNAAWVEKLRARQIAAPTQSRAKRSASGALLTDLPLDRFIKFSDPLLAREVKSRFRLRRAGFWVGLVRFALFLVAAGVWLFEVFWLFDPPSRDGIVPYGLRALLYGGTLCLGVLAATSWTRERESGTWESLKLSLLTPREILRAKWLSPLVSFGYYAVPLLIVLPIGAFYIPFQSFMVGTLVVAAWLSLAVALGLWISWRVKNGTAAIAWTAGLLMGLLVAVPWISDLAGINDALASWKYGVGGYRDANLFYIYNGFSVNTDIKRRYQAATGRVAPQPMRIPTRTGQVMTFPMGWNDFQRWGTDQIRDAEQFKARLNIWHPGATLDRLFADNDRKNNSGYARQNLIAPDDSTTALLLSTLAPLALTLILLALLRRDVKREQLGL